MPKAKKREIFVNGKPRKWWIDDVEQRRCAPLEHPKSGLSTLPWPDSDYVFVAVDVRAYELLQEENKKLRELAEMVEDNTKMPHKHSDYYERLCCLSERAREVLEGSKDESR